MNKKRAQSWLFRHHAYMKFPLLLLSIVNVVLSLTALFFAFYSKETIDAAISSNQNRFVSFAIIISAIMIINLLFLALNQYLRVMYKGVIDQRMKDHLFKKIMKAQSKFTNKTHSGVYMTRLDSDVEHIADGMIEVIPRLVFYVVRFSGAFILLFLIDQMFALLFLGLGVLMFLVSRVLSKEMKRRHQKLQLSLEKAKSMMQESIENITVIKTFQAEEKMINIQDTHQKDVLRAKIHKNNLSIFVSSGLNIFFAFGYVFAIIFGAYRLQYGLSIGSLLAMIQLVQHIQSPFSGLSLLVPKYYQMLSSTERVMEIDSYLDEKSEYQYDPHAFKEIIVNDLYFQYEDQKKVIENLSFTLKKGELIHLQGESGKGKTTLFKLLLALIEPEQGSIKVVTQDQEFDISFETRSFFSYVPQENLILSGTIRDNLNLYQTYDDEKLFNVLKISEMYQEVMNLPNQLDTQLGERGKGLSEGQIQRLAIARALLKDAPVLLFDEITSSLDQKTEELIMKNIKQMTDKTCLMSSHRPLSVDIVTHTINLTKIL